MLKVLKETKCHNLKQSKFLILKNKLDPLKISQELTTLMILSRINLSDKFKSWRNSMSSKLIRDQSLVMCKKFKIWLKINVNF